MGNPLRGIKDKMPLWLGESLSCHVLGAGRCSIDASVPVIGGDGQGTAGAGESPAQLLTLR